METEITKDNIDQFVFDPSKKTYTIRDELRKCYMKELEKAICEVYMPKEKTDE